MLSLVPYNHVAQRVTEEQRMKEEEESRRLALEEEERQAEEVPISLVAISNSCAELLSSLDET